MTAITQNIQKTMSSFDLRSVINAAREAHGENPVQNNHLLTRIEDELEGDLGGCKTFTPESGGAPIRYYDLNRDQCALVGMRESKGVRRNVLATLRELEAQQVPAIPQTYADALRLAADTQDALDSAIATKAQIGNRREATAMNTASTATRRANKLERDLDRAKEYCTIKRMSMLTHGQKYSWRMLKSASKDVEIPPIDVFDANYGTVKAYHAEAWLEAYGLEVAA